MPALGVRRKVLNGAGHLRYEDQSLARCRNVGLCRRNRRYVCGFCILCACVLMARLDVPVRPVSCFGVNLLNNHIKPVVGCVRQF